jgi:hypothetical protein
MNLITQSGVIHKLTLGQFLERFHADDHAAILASVDRYPKAEALILYRGGELRTAMVVGPENTHTLAAVTRGLRLGRLPDQQYPVAYVDLRKGACTVCDNCQGRGEFPDHCACVTCGGLGYTCKPAEKRSITITKEEAEFAKLILALETFAEGYDRDGVIMTKSADFGNGIEADIKLCNGDSPYVDAVLFENGSELMALDVGDEFEGEFVFEIGGKRYVVDVEASDDPEKLWTCPGCGCQIAESDNDMILDHVRDCNKVDGGGQRV